MKRANKLDTGKGAVLKNTFEKHKSAFMAENNQTESRFMEMSFAAPAETTISYFTKTPQRTCLWRRRKFHAGNMSKCGMT